MQENEEKTAVIIDLQDEQAEEKTIAKAKAEVKEVAGKPFFLKWAFRRVEGNLLDWWDTPAERPRTRKQSFKRVLLLPAQMVSVLVFGACLSLAYLLFGDPEENES